MAKAIPRAGKDAAIGTSSLESVFTASPHIAFIQLSRARKGTRAFVTILSIAANV